MIHVAFSVTSICNKYGCLYVAKRTGPGEWRQIFLFRDTDHKPNKYCQVSIIWRTSVGIELLITQM